MGNTLDSAASRECRPYLNRMVIMIDLQSDFQAGCSGILSEGNMVSLGTVFVNEGIRCKDS